MDDDLRLHQLEMENRELREAQQQLEESRNRYADLYDFAPVGDCTLDARGRILEANLTAATLLGIERQTLIGQPIERLVSAEDRKRLAAHLRSCAVDKRRTTSEITFSIGGRGKVILQLVSAPLANACGDTTGCRTTITDVSRLRLIARASELLVSSLDVTATLGEVVRMAVPLVADLCIVDVVEGDQLKRVEVVYHDAELDLVAADLRQRAPRLDDESPQAHAIRTAQPTLHAGGSQLDGIRVRSAIYMPMMARGRVLGVMSFLLAEPGRCYTPDDLRFASDFVARAAVALDNARLYREARDAVTARDEVLSVVSHDLRNPLSTIVLAADLLLRQGSKVEPLHNTLKRAAAQMRHLISNLIDLSSIDSGRLSIEAREQDLNSILDEALQLVAPLSDSGHVDLRVLRHPDCCRVVCDRQRVLQVLSNLLGNALKYTPPGGTITVSIEPSGERACIAVQDSGPGIAEDEVEHVFDRFWQGHDARPGGRGLGLYISKGIVEAQGGKIWVRSTRGEGSTFYFTVPCQSQLIKMAVNPDTCSAS